MTKNPDNPSVDDIIRKYGAKIEGQIKTESVGSVNYSRDYLTFKEEMAPELTRYEKWCNSLGSLVKLKISKKDEDKVRKSLEIAHLDLEPWQALNLGVMAFVFTIVFGLLISIAIALVNSADSSSILSGLFDNFPFLFFFLMIIIGLFLFYYLSAYPNRLANKWRLKASSQMVPAILYIVVYMRHTPNLEKAIAFASQHLQYPLSLDFKKVFYNVQVAKFSTIKESLDNYLEIWRDYSPEFIEAFHLIESSLFEPEEGRRIVILEKSLQVVLDGVYDRMLKFVHDVKSPLTNVYMLGVVLPTLGLALLPLASAMVSGLIKTIHVFLLFVIIIPFLVFFLTDKVLFLRPGGYGETDLLERNPLYPEYASRKPYVKAFLICLPFFIIAFLPLIFQYTPVPDLLGMQKDFSLSSVIGIGGDAKFFGFQQDGDTGGTVGPFGIGALLCGMFLPIGLALFFSIAYKEKTKNLIEYRNKTRQLEEEFNSSLFQLGNRIGNGIPPELAFGKVAESAKGLRTGDFFNKVNYNITQLGMSVDRAIFDVNRGVINEYPSELIATSMKVLIESSKKGLKIAALSLMSISEYVKNISKITERLRDMLAEIASDMKSNMTFLAPLLSGIVVGLAAMITSILGQLNLKMVGGNLGTDLAGAGTLTNLLKLFDMSKMIPPYYLQIAIGIYLVEIIFILSGALVTINSGEDKLETTNKTGQNLKRGILLYFITAFIATVALFFLSSIVIGSIG